jgi:hypothetical protein
MSFRQLRYFTGGFIFLIGIVIVLLTILICPETNKIAIIWGTSGALFANIGMALIGLGLISCVVQTRAWREYFETRLREVVVKQSYLKSLAPLQLRDLLAGVFKALLNSPDIEKEGSFFNYFRQNLTSLLSEPYREDVSGEIVLMGDTDNTFKIFDRLSYVCRKGRDAIQEEVKMSCDENELLQVANLKIEIQYPRDHPEKGGQRNTIGMKKEFLERDTHNKIGFRESLADYKHIDGLIVTITSEDTVHKELFQYWQMSQATKNYDLTIRCPEKYHIQIKPLVLHPEMCQLTEKPGYVRLKYNCWTLPEAGAVAWRFIERSNLRDMFSESTQDKQVIAK